MSQTDAPQTDLVTLTGRAQMPAHVRTGGGIQKLNSVLDHPAPAELVQGLTTGELYYLMQDIGKGNAYPLVELASDEQLQGV